MKNSAIEWCDHTFNPWEGCTKVSAGCAHCYAEARNARFGGGTAPNWGPGAPRRRTSAHNWNEPRRWNLKAGAGIVDGNSAIGRSVEYPRQRVFCASLADWLDDEVPIAWLADLLTLIYETPDLDWLLLTKRPQNWRPRLIEVMKHNERTDGPSDVHAWVLDWAATGGSAKPPAHVWIGTSVENQAMADQRIPALLSIPARVRFLSCEPLLGPVDFLTAVAAAVPPKVGNRFGDWVQWVIAGGESGPGARPMHPDWARALRDQCAAAGVSFFFKQWGEWLSRSQVLLAGNEAAAIELVRKPALKSAVMRRDSGIDDSLVAANTSNDSDSSIYRVGKPAAGRQLDGVEHGSFPKNGGPV